VSHHGIAVTTVVCEKQLIKPCQVETALYGCWWLLCNAVVTALTVHYSIFSVCNSVVTACCCSLNYVLQWCWHSCLLSVNCHLLLGIIIVDLVFIVVIVIHFVNAPQKNCTKWNYLWKQITIVVAKVHHGYMWSRNCSGNPLMQDPYVSSLVPCVHWPSNNQLIHEGESSLFFISLPTAGTSSTVGHSYLYSRQ